MCAHKISISTGETKLTVIEYKRGRCMAKKIWNRTTKIHGRLLDVFCFHLPFNFSMMNDGVLFTTIFCITVLRLKFNKI